MTTPRVATGAIVRQGYSTLMIRRGPDAVNGAGEWSIPGGKLDPGETLAQGAGRELFEETGTVGDVMEHTGVFTEDMDWGAHLHFVTHYLHAAEWHGEPRIMEPHKHDGMLWIHDDDLVGFAAGNDPAFRLFPPTLRLVQSGILIRL